MSYSCSDFDTVNDNEDDGEPARKMTKAKRQSLVETLKSATVGFNKIKLIKSIAFVVFFRRKFSDATPWSPIICWKIEEPLCLHSHLIPLTSMVRTFLLREKNKPFFS